MVTTAKEKGPKSGDCQTWPQVAIVILNWNGWAHTVECLESVFRNDYPRYSVIVCDNGSQDNSVGFIEAWADGRLDLSISRENPLRFLSFPPVPKPIPYTVYDKSQVESDGLVDEDDVPLVLVRTGANLGFAGGNNVGVKYAMARIDPDYIWLLNNDTIIDKEALVEMVRLMKRNRGIGIAGSKLLDYANPKTIQTLGGSKEVYRFRPNRSIQLGHTKAELDYSFEIGGYISGTSLLIRNEVIASIGLLDADYFMYGEDADWSLRASRDGWKLFCCSKSRVWHKGWASYAVRTPKRFLGIQSRRCSWSGFAINGYYGIRGHVYLLSKFRKSELFLSCQDKSGYR